MFKKFPLKYYFKRIRKSSYVDHFQILLKGSVLGQAFAIGLYPVLSRIYTPSMYGTVAILATISGLLGCVATGRYHMAIILPKDDRDAYQLLWISGLLLAGTCLVTLAVTLAWSNPIAKRFGNQDIAGILWFTALFTLLPGIQQLLLCWSNRFRSYKLMSLFRVIRAPLNAGLPILAGIFWLPSAYLLAGFQLIGHFLATLFLLIGLKPHSFLDQRPIIPRWSDLKKIALYYKDYPLTNTWIALQDVFSASLPVLVFSYVFNSAVVGSFAFATNILRMPSALIGEAVGRVFLERIAHLDKQHQFFKFVLANLLGLLCIMTPVTIVLLFWGKPLFILFLGKKWELAGTFATYLAIPVSLAFIMLPLQGVFLVKKKLRLNFVLSTVALIMRAGALLIGNTFNNYVVAVALYCIADSLGTIIVLWAIITISKGGD